MQINKAKRTLLLKGTKMGQTPKHQCYKKQKYTAKSSVPRKQEQKENEGESSGLTKMAILTIQAEHMIKESKTDSDSMAKINTLKGILNMLVGQNDVPKEDENIHKKDENISKIDDTDENSENKMKSISSAQEGSEISTEKKRHYQCDSKR